jgi:2-oxoglutarate ferredoxin oxidoreductase subunit beta
MTYIVENNGVYGLTKGPVFGDRRSRLEEQEGRAQPRFGDRSGHARPAAGRDLRGTRIFRRQDAARPADQGALLHQGAAFLDVISPCVAFNNHDGSTKSYDYVREHNEAVNRLDVMLPREPIAAEYAPGEVREVVQHDGSVLRLHKLATDHEPNSRTFAMNFLQQRQEHGEVVTGLLYVDPEAQDLHANLNTVDKPFNELAEPELCPGASALERFNASLR